MAAVARGDENAFRRLVQRWEGPVLSFLTRCLADPEEARDLAQEVFLRVHRHAGRYRPEGAFRAWIFRIAGNLCRQRHRRRRLARWIPLLPQHEPPTPRTQRTDARLRAEEISRVLEEVLETLPLRQRMAFSLQRIEGLSYREIARVLGTSESAVESLLVRATRSVREGLRERGMTPGG